jgi:hypothetical protein
MKKYIFIMLIFFLHNSCDSKDAGDCFQTAGEIVKNEVGVPFFDKVVVHKNIELFIEEGPLQKVEVETGENLFPEIIANVIDGELILTNENKCNFVREYSLTKVYVTTPNLTVIRNASELNVNSIGVLAYPSLYLMSVGQKRDFLSVGDFHLTIENESVRIWGNGIATFFLNGTSDKLNVDFSNGDTRLEGKDFKVKDITLRNVSSNDMILYPEESVVGTIHSTGNVILYNTSPIVDVQELSVGELIIK